MRASAPNILVIALLFFCALNFSWESAKTQRSAAAVVVVVYVIQVELENWVNSIHSACAAAFARHRGKTGTLHLLQEEIFRLDKAIESVSVCLCVRAANLSRINRVGDYIYSCIFLYLLSPVQDHKLKHMADLQQSVVNDQDTRHQIQQQITTWEENLERLHCEQFRLRCYMASLQCGELPNPKVTLLDFWWTNFMCTKTQTLTFSLSFSITVTFDTRLTPHQEHPQQAGRLHRVVVPCLHLCTLTIAVEQLARWPWCHQASSTVAIAIQQRLESSLDAGLLNLFF